MRKFLLATTFIIACFISTKAQSDASRFHVGVGPTVALPIGNLGDDYSFGVGGEVQGEYMFSDKFSCIANTNYIHFRGKKGIGYLYQERHPRFNLIPVLVGLRAYPVPNFFIGARGGLGITISEGDAYGMFDYRTEVGYNGQVIQVAFAFNGRTKNGYSANYFGLTGIYIFGRKKD